MWPAIFIWSPLATTLRRLTTLPCSSICFETFMLMSDGQYSRQNQKHKCHKQRNMKWEQTHPFSSEANLGSLCTPARLTVTSRIHKVLWCKTKHVQRSIHTNGEFKRFTYSWLILLERRFNGFWFGWMALRDSFCGARRLRLSLDVFSQRNVLSRLRLVRRDGRWPPGWGRRVSEHGRWTADHRRPVGNLVHIVRFPLLSTLGQTRSHFPCTCFMVYPKWVECMLQLDPSRWDCVSLTSWHQ